MSFEFVHTSVEKGIRGDSGFAIAVVTRGIPASLEPMLAELSAYDFDRTRAVGADRIDWAHRILSVHGKSYTVLSRTAPCGSDWSGRPNRIAHHLVVEPHERASAGPAWLLTRFARFCESVPTAEERGVGPSLPQGDEAPRPAHGWESAGFDRGWAGVVAQALLDAPSSAVCVVLPDEVDALPLASDVLAVVPADKRWLITFSTRFQRLPAGGRCQLRFLRAGASGVRAMLAEPGVRAIEVGRGVSAGDGDAANAAREGRLVEPTVRAAPSLRVNPVLQAAPVLDDAPFEVRMAAPRRTDDAPIQSHSAIDGDIDAATPVPAPRIEAVLRADDRAGDPHRTRLIAFLLFAYSAVALAIATVLFLA
ncbi:MAG: hypothetical protein RLY21_2453 [Planctomycetota bacterium]|jgi:hypothetical protein